MYKISRFFDRLYDGFPPSLLEEKRCPFKMEKQTLAHVKRYLNGLVGLEPVVGLHLSSHWLASDESQSRDFASPTKSFRLFGLENLVIVFLPLSSSSYSLSFSKQKQKNNKLSNKASRVCHLYCTDHTTSIESRRLFFSFFFKVAGNEVDCAAESMTFSELSWDRNFLPKMWNVTQNRDLTQKMVYAHRESCFDHIWSFSRACMSRKTAKHGFTLKQVSIMLHN